MISTAQQCYNVIQEFLAELNHDDSANKRLVSYLLQASDMIEAHIEDQANLPEEYSVGDEPI